MEYQKISEAVPRTSHVNTELKEKDGVQYSIQKKQSKALMIKHNDILAPGFYIEVNTVALNRSDIETKTVRKWFSGGEWIPVKEDDEWSGDRSSAILTKELGRVVNTENFVSKMLEIGA